LREFFSGGRTMIVNRGGYEEPIAVPRVPAAAVDAAVTASVCDGKLWLTSGPASFLAEEVPAGLLSDDAALQAPPPPIPPIEVLAQTIPEAWTDGATTGQILAVAISKRVGKVIPWVTVREAIEGALRARMIERLADSGPWPCDFAGSSSLRLRVTTGGPVPPEPTPPTTPSPRPGTWSGEARLQPSQIQDLADVMGELLRARRDCELSFSVRLELTGKETPSEEVISEVNRVLKNVNHEFQVR